MIYKHIYPHSVDNFIHTMFWKQEGGAYRWRWHFSLKSVLMPKYMVSEQEWVRPAEEKFWQQDVQREERDYQCRNMIYKHIYPHSVDNFIHTMFITCIWNIKESILQWSALKVWFLLNFPWHWCVFFIQSICYFPENRKEDTYLHKICHTYRQTGTGDSFSNFRKISFNPPKYL